MSSIVLTTPTASGSGSASATSWGTITGTLSLQLDLQSALDLKVDTTIFDAHVADTTLHFSEASIDHLNILNVGVNTHADLDAHVADTTLHFSEASIDHLNISNIGVNTHADIDAHVAGISLKHTASDILFDDTIVGGGFTEVQSVLDVFDDQIGLRETAATGIIEGGGLTRAGSPPSTNMINIAGGAGEIVNGYDDRRNPTRNNINWDPLDDFVIEFPSMFGAQVIYVDSASVIKQQSNILTNSQRRTNIQLGFVFYDEFGITVVHDGGVLSNEVGNLLYDFIYQFSANERINGMGLRTVNNALSVYAETGKFLSPGVHVSVNITDPNIIDFPAIGDVDQAAPFKIVYSDGSVHTAVATIMPDFIEVFPPTTPPTSANLIGNNAAIHYLFRTLDNTLILQLGQTEYNDARLARDNLDVDRNSYTFFPGSTSAFLVAQSYNRRAEPNYDNPRDAGLVSLIGSGSNAGGGVPVTDFLSLNDVQEETYSLNARKMVSVNDVDGTNGDGLVFTDDPVRWRGKWSSQQYLKNDMVIDGTYLGVAIEDNTSRPQPQPIGNPIFALPAPPPWVGDLPQSEQATVECIHDYTMTQDGWLKRLNIWSYSGSDSVDYESRIYIYDYTNPLVPLLTNQINNPVLAENAWSTVVVTNVLVSVDTVLRVVFLQVHNAGGVTINGGWSLGKFNDSTGPAIGGWNSNHQNSASATILRIHRLDLDGVDRSNEISGIIVNSTIRFVQTDNTNKSIDFLVASSSIVDLGEYFEITVSGGTEGSNGRPDDNSINTMDTFVPVGVDTDFVVAPSWWLTNQPVFANVIATLKFDGAEQIGGTAPQNAYGIDVEFQQASISPSWDIIPVEASVGGGGGVNDFLSLNDVQEETYSLNARKMVSVNDIDGANGNGLVFTDEPMRWKNKWVPRQYLTNDMVRDGNWTMVANKDTTDRAAPQNIGGVVDSIDLTSVPDDIGFAQAIVEMNHTFTMSKMGYLKTLDVYIPNIDANLFIKVTIAIGDDSRIIENPTIASDVWATIAANSTLVLSGTDVFVRLQLYHSSAASQIKGGWTSNIGTGAPANQQFNISSTANDVVGGTFAIDHTDLDSVERTTELRGISIGSTIVLVETGDAARSTTIITTSADTTNTDVYSTFTYDWVDTGTRSGIRDNRTISITVNVPIIVNTDYPKFLAPPVPSFATVVSDLKFDGVDQAAPVDTIYGIGLSFQEAAISPDWEVVALADVAANNNNVVSGSNGLQRFGNQSINGEEIFTADNVRKTYSGSASTSTQTVTSADPTVNSWTMDSNVITHNLGTTNYSFIATASVSGTIISSYDKTANTITLSVIKHDGGVVSAPLDFIVSLQV